MRLLLTVSGGLEDLAERQARLAFAEDELQKLSWQRKPSGSRLHLTLQFANDGDDDVSRLVDALRSWDYVEYVYILLSSADIETEVAQVALLRQIREASSRISQTSLAYCKTLSDAIAERYPVDVGLDGLPGQLLPTPELVASSDMQTEAVGESRAFDVNTIYTEPGVAAAVMRTITQFCEEQLAVNVGDAQTLWLDAGSGNGALLEHMPQHRSVGVDTHPTSVNVLQMDFLQLPRGWLHHRFPHHERLVVVSNPPFSTASRGDFTPIVHFINHSFDALGADVVAVLCPCKFARQRIWQSLGMTGEAVLLGRFFLPQNAFYNPSNGEEVHIHSYCLIFGRGRNAHDDPTTTQSANGIYLSAKRDKGCFPNLLTPDLSKAVATGLSEAGVNLVAENDAKYAINAQLASTLELWWHVNPQRPCSLANSNGARVSHSLGWMSLSIKPPIALAMASMAFNSDTRDGARSPLAINLMSGEGTIELEARRAEDRSFFMLSGDKSHENARKAARRLQQLKHGSGCRSLVDVVVWDAQRLPLRKGFADVLFADLPFQGSNNNAHQEPAVGSIEKKPKVALPALSYCKVLQEANRVLRAKGRAAILSADTKALRHAAGQFNWRPLGDSRKINSGGLPAQIFLMERKEACTKDLSLWVPPSAEDFGPWILDVSRKACGLAGGESSIKSVTLHSTFVHKERGLSHCYRVEFDDMVRNVEAKRLEQRIRKAIEEEALHSVILR
ncbi:hypothetical protein ACHAXT_003760 [Thalassiosira profunda]